MENFKIGYMQGRLSPMENEAYQFFPKTGSCKEFSIAQDIGLKAVELVFDGADGKGHHLLNSPESLMLDNWGLTAPAILADFFIKNPLRNDNTFILSDLIRNSYHFGTTVIDVPFIENSQIRPSNKKEVIEAIQSCFWLSSICNVKIALETDMHPQQLSDFIDELRDAGGEVDFPLIGVNLDTGNSAAAGHDPEKEIDILKDKIFSVHIKDRLLDGKTVPLGTGAVDFPTVFRKLREVGYSGSYILQAARSTDGDEAKCVAGQIEFLKKHLEVAWA